MKKSYILILFIFSTIFISCSNTKTISDDNVVTITKKESTDERFSNQDMVDKELLRELKNNYTLDNPYYTLDPYDQSPLTGVVIFNTKESSEISIRISGKDKYSAIEHEFDEYSTEHIIPIYGLYANKNNKIDIIATSKDGKKISKTIYMQTEPLPQDFSKVKVRIKIPSKMAKGLTFFDCPHANGN